MILEHNKTLNLLENHAAYCWLSESCFDVVLQPSLTRGIVWFLRIHHLRELPRSLQ